MEIHGQHQMLVTFNLLVFQYQAQGNMELLLLMALEQFIIQVIKDVHGLSQILEMQIGGVYLYQVQDNMP